MQSLYDLYKSGAGPSQAQASLSTWCRVYQKNWSATLLFRSAHQHTKCNLCTRLRVFRSLAKHPEQKRKVARAHELHVSRVLADRSTMHRLMRMSEQYARTNTGEQIGFIQVDGMDHAKFAIPRWTDTSKEWENRWRPFLQCIGGIFWGVCEYWFLFDCDLPKDANMQCTVLALITDDTQTRMAQKQTEFPRHLTLNTDNTPSETKNVTCFTFAAWLVFKKKVDTIDLMQGQIGHTHNEEDQRFSVARAALRRSDKLEVPTDFRDQIVKGVIPVRGRSQHAEVLTGSFDWNDFFSTMGNIRGLLTGHTETKHTKERGEEAVHFWRFMRRENVECGVPLVEWPGYEHHPDDVVLMVKFYASSTTPCTALRVFLPAALLAKSPPQCAELTEMEHSCLCLLDGIMDLVPCGGVCANASKQPSFE